MEGNWILGLLILWFSLVLYQSCKSTVEKSSATEVLKLKSCKIYSKSLDSLEFEKLKQHNKNLIVSPKIILDKDSVLEALNAHLWLSITGNNESYTIDSLYFFNGEKWFADSLIEDYDGLFLEAYYPEEMLLQYDVVYPQDCFVDMRTGNFNRQIGNPKTAIYSPNKTYRITQFYNGMEMSYFLECKKANNMYEYLTTMPYPTFKFYWKSDNEVAFKLEASGARIWEITT